MSGTGPRFIWDNTSDFILLFSLLSDTKIGSGGWDAASVKLAEKGFLSSDGNPIKASAISQHYTKLRAQVMKLAAESTPTSTGGSPAAAAAECTPATPKRTRNGRPKQTSEQKAAAKAAREAKKAAGATSTKGGGRSSQGIEKEGPYMDKKHATTRDEQDSDEPMMVKRNEHHPAGTPSKKRRMSSVVKKVEKVNLVNLIDSAESAGSAEMEISDSQ